MLYWTQAGRRLGGAALGMMAVAGSAWAEEEHVFFHEEVEPILQEHCVKCHGGGEGRPEAGFDLTQRARLMSAINADAPDSSLLLDMISYRDPEHEMPPAGRLPQEMIDTITEWVAQGAAMPESFEPELAEESGGHRYNNQINDESRNWWSYVPVERPALPEVDDAKWSVNPIDRFVYAKAREHGLTPNGPASRRDLIRRAYYDLTGLPPTPEEVEAFASDPSRTAYEDLVDRLLDSPHYGEKWARHWLDIVRYAETHGYERDNPKPYIWRYRDYVIQALNDDKPYDQFVMEQLAADEMEDAEPEALAATGFYRLGVWNDEPADVEQVRYDVLDGIVATTGEAFLGITMGCARCHDHKIDPIPQRDYYRMLSFVHNVTDMHTTNITRSILSADEQSQYEEAKKEATREINRTELRLRKLKREFAAALKEQEPQLFGSRHTSDMTDVTYRFFRGRYDVLPDYDNLKHEDEGAANDDFFDIAHRTRDNDIGFVFEGTLHVPEDGEYIFTLDSDDGSRLTLDGEVIAELNETRRFGLPTRAARTLKQGAYPIRLDYFQQGGDYGLYVAWSGPGFEERALSNTANRVNIDELFEQRLGQVLGEFATRRKELLVNKIDRLRNQEVPGGKYAAAVFENGKDAPETFVFARGNPHAPGKKVEPGFPEVLGFPDPVIEAPESGDTSGRRIHLARWIASKENPLTARVMMNRIWQFHFGKGIVESPSDLGQSGLPPSHPELLDWLAAELMAGDWRMKRMHRMILLSRAYRMSSRLDESDFAKDPANKYLWRFDMRRLTAEELRDTILAVNGRLNPELGGPPVYPPLPREVLETSSRPDQAWGQATEAQAARRSIYIHVKRSLRHPFLKEFDQADTDTTCPVRFSTTLPTQALSLMNSDFIHEQARVFAERLAQETSVPEEQVRLALELATGRPARPAEIERGVSILNEMLHDYGHDSDAALTRLALVVLNLNEFVFLD